MPKNKKTDTILKPKNPQAHARGMFARQIFFWRLVLVVEFPLPETNMAPENCDSFSFLKIQLSCQMPSFSFREGIFGRLEKIFGVFGLGADIQKRGDSAGDF